MEALTFLLKCPCMWEVIWRMLWSGAWIPSIQNGDQSCWAKLFYYMNQEVPEQWFSLLVTNSSGVGERERCYRDVSAVSSLKELQAFLNIPQNNWKNYCSKIKNEQKVERTKAEADRKQTQTCWNLGWLIIDLYRFLNPTRLTKGFFLL